MVTRSKNIKSKFVKVILVVMYIACFVAMGAITAYAPAYEHYRSLYSCAEKMFTDDYEKSVEYADAMKEYIQQVREFDYYSRHDLNTLVYEADFYCKFTYIGGKTVYNGINYRGPVYVYEEGNGWNYPGIGSMHLDGNLNNFPEKIEIAMSVDEYEHNAYNWNVIRDNLYIILFSDIALIIVAIIILAVLCKVSFVRDEGEVVFPKNFRLFYEITLCATMFSAVLAALVVYGWNDLLYIASRGNAGKTFYMIVGAGVFALLGALLSYLALSITARVKNKCVLEGLLVFRVLRLCWRILKWFGRQLVRTLRFIEELFTGELYKADSAAKRILWVDLAFFGVTALNVIVVLLLESFTWLVIAIVLEVIFFVLFIYGRHLMLRDGAIVERQIMEIYNGNYNYRDELSKNSPYRNASDKLYQLGNQYRRGVEESVKAERMKIDLVTNVSHDLKTPLTSIISYVELLSKEELPPVARDYVEILSKKSERLKNIVSDVFELAKTTSGEIEVSRERLDLSKLSYQTLGEMEDKIIQSGFQIKSQICEPPVAIISDGKRVYRIIQNLLDNALKYSLTGTRIYYTLEKRDERAYITVKNIASYEMDFTTEEILERFTRGDKSRSTEGSGLGLSIAQGFALACGGELDIEIDGDMFKAIVSFPLAIDEPVAEDKPAPEKQSNGASCSDIVAAVGARLKKKKAQEKSEEKVSVNE